MNLRKRFTAISLLLLMGTMFLLFSVASSSNAVTMLLDYSATDSQGNPDPGVPFQPDNGTKFKLEGNNTYQIRTQTGFRMNITCDCDCEMNMTQYQHYDEAPFGSTTQTMSRYMYIWINQTAAKINATLAWKIGDDELEGLNRSTLRFAFHNRSTNTWQYTEQNWQEGDTVFCKTTHFSMWTVVGEPNNPEPGTPFTAGNGTNFQLKDNNTYQIRTQSQFRVNVSCDRDCEMNMTEYQYYGEAPEGATLSRYMKIELNQTEAKINATLAWKVGDDELEGLNRTTLRFAFHNGTTNMWQHVEQNWQEGEMVMCNTTHFSMWTITGELADGPGNPTPGTPFQAGNGTAFQLQAGEKYQIRTQSGFKMNMSANAQVNMTVTECESNPVGELAQNRRHLGYFWNFSLQGTADIQATFEWTFKNSDIAGLKKETLKFAYYDENAKSWKYGEENWIVGNTVYCNSTHFSTWTVIGEEESETTPTPGFTWLIGLVALAAVLVPVRKIKHR